MTKSQQIQKAAEDLMLYDLTYSEEYKKALAVPYQPRHTEPMFPVAPKIVLGIFIILNAVNLIFFHHIAKLWENVFLIALFLFFIICNSRQKKKTSAAVSDSAHSAETLRQNREEKRRTLEQLLAASPKISIFPFWQYIDWTTIHDRFINGETLNWTNPNMIYQDEDGIFRLYNLNQDGVLVSGAYIQELMETTPFLEIPLETGPVIPDKNYLMGQLILTQCEDASFEVKGTVSEESIQDQLTEYDSTLDQRERLYNMVQGHGPFTNDERMFAQQMDGDDYIQAAAFRSVRQMDRESRVRANSGTTTTLDAGTWNHTDEPVGVIFMEPESQLAFRVLLYKEEKRQEIYQTTSSTRGMGEILRHQMTSFTTQSPRAYTLIKCFHLNIPPIDLKKGRPEGFTDEDWACLIYGSGSIKV